MISPGEGSDSSILVTGGAGFIGSAVVRYLIRETAHRVVNLDKLTYAGNKINLNECMHHARHHFVQGDILDRELVASLLAKFDVRMVLHLAAESHVDRSIDSPTDFLNTNILGTFALLEEFRRHIGQIGEDKASKARFCHVSTDEVFGSLGPSGKFTETSAYDPSSPYSASKAAADHLVRAWGRTYGVPAHITNCSNNFGPYQYPEKLIPLIILNALERRPLPIYGDGQNVRDWLYVEDHAEAIYAIACRGSKGETYNIGSRSERTNLQVVNAICTALDSIVPTERPYSELITFVQDRPGHDFRYAIDPRKVEQEIGWRAKRDFESAIEETVKWYLNSLDWCAEVQQGSAGRARLGLTTGMKQAQ